MAEFVEVVGIGTARIVLNLDSVSQIVENQQGGAILHASGFDKPMELDAAAWNKLKKNLVIRRPVADAVSAGVRKEPQE